MSEHRHYKDSFEEAGGIRHRDPHGYTPPPISKKDATPDRLTAAELDTIEELLFIHDDAQHRTFSFALVASNAQLLLVECRALTSERDELARINADLLTLLKKAQFAMENAPTKQDIQDIIDLVKGGRHG